MVIINPEYALKIHNSVLAFMNVDVDNVQTQLSNLTSTYNTLQLMGTNIDKDIRMEAQEAVLARACILQDPEYNKNLMKLEGIIARVVAANTALQNDTLTNTYLNNQIKHYTTYKKMKKWMDKLGELSALAYKIRNSSEVTIQNDTGSNTDFLNLFLDEDDYVKDKCDIIKEAKSVEYTITFPSSTSADYAVGQFCNEFVKLYNESLNGYDKNEDYLSVCQIINNPPADVRQLLKDLNAQKTTNAEDDNQLLNAVNNALEEYNVFDVGKLNTALTNCIDKCKMNVAPYSCECFNNPTTKYDKNTVTVTDADTAATATKNIVVKHHDYLSNLYNNSGIVKALTRLSDDTSATQIPDVMAKTKNLTKQML